MTTSEWMLKYAERGWYVFPVWGVTADGGCRCSNPKCDPKDAGKHPMTPHGKNDATTSRETIINWCKKWPDCNAAIVAGTSSGLIIFDIDPRHGGDKSLVKLQEELGPLPTTLNAVSGGGGKHLYFDYPKRRTIYDTTTKLGGGIDVRASVRGNEGLGGYVVGPPSVHRSGGAYEWEDFAITTGPLPATWLDRLEEAPAEAVHWEEDMEILEGQRSTFITHCAGKFRNEGYVGDELLMFLLTMNESRCKPPLPSAEVERIAKGISKKPINYFRNTDIGNGKRLAARWGSQLRHCYEMKQWYTWDGTRWAKDGGVVVTRAAKVTTEEAYKEAKRMEEPYRTATIKWSKSSQAASRVGAMIEMARTEGVIAIKADELDADIFAFNVLNGTVDLRTGELRKHNRADLITKLGPVDCVKVDRRSEAARLWYKYLREVMGNEEQERWLQLAVGYSMTGSIIMEKAFFLCGLENTGKDTLITAVTTCMGDYYDVIDPAIFYYRGTVKAGPTPELAKLPGVRVAAATEFKKGMRLSEDKFKRSTGGTEITCRSLYGHPFKYWPHFKLWMTMNDLPVTDAYGTGIWRRVIVIPFEFTPKVVNYKLKERCKLDMDVRSVVLDWMIGGAKRWLAGERLEDLAPSVEKATKAYKEGQNPLKNWFEEHYERHDAQVVHKEYPSLGAIQYTTLYDDAIEHCRKHKLYIDHWGFKGLRTFAQQLRKLFPWLGLVGDTSKRRLNIRHRVIE